MENKIIRSICLFTDAPTSEQLEKIGQIEKILQQHAFTVQTKRICTNTKNILATQNAVSDPSYLLSIGTLSLEQAKEQFQYFINSRVNCNIDLSSELIEQKYVGFLFDIIQQNPAKTFDFTFVFNSPPSSPYFPSANYEKNGFSLGLQPTDLTEGCTTVEQWLEKMRNIWNELHQLFKQDSLFLGIDSSIAPLFEGSSSLVHFIKSLGMTFSKSTTTDTYITITKFLKTQNPKPIGLCGLMFPCLEDFALAEEYEKGEFSIERNTYLSLHSGLGIDTYPIGVNEQKERVIEILKLIQALSNKYKKPLSVRFVSDGKAKIGEKTNFGNQYLKDILILPL
jgi:hypothetical protein